MKNRVLRAGLTVAAVTAIWAFVHVSTLAQGPAPAAAAWEPAHTTDGQPDMQGYWFNSHMPSPSTSIEEAFWRRPREDKGGATFKSPIVDPPDGKIPYLPWAAAKRLELNRLGTQTVQSIDPHARCFPHGVPRVIYQYHENPIQILQTPGYVVFMHESFNTYRVIPLDSGPHLGERLKLWMGDSRGRWEGNTLIVDVKNLNGKAWFDETGTFQSDAMTVVERFTLTGANSIHYEATITDPTLFEQPWTMVFPLSRVQDPKLELLEQACHEGERSAKALLERLVKTGSAK